MVFFNYATMQMAAKIVYYGPGLCGKTTNLHHIYAKTSPQSRGEMVSLETETDRTLFFDLLPIDVGVIGGFKTRLQLYTIPGQVFYNTTRKLVLKGVDGIVFVADSQVPALQGNVDSFSNLRDNLAEIGLSVDEIPLVIQLNKRDLPNVVSVDEMLDALDPDRNHEYVEAVAATGAGVFETLKVISKLTLRTLRRRMTGEEPPKPASRKLGDNAQFRVNNAAGLSRETVSSPLSDAGGGSAAAVADAPADDAIAEIAASATEDAASVEPATVEAIAPAPVETEIDFREEEEKPAEAPVKRVKVRSTIDVMAELEALRKRATTQAPAKPKKDSAPATRSREIFKEIAVTIPPLVLPQTKSLKVTLSFQNSDGGVVHEREQTIELEDTSDASSVSVNLKIDQS